MTQPQMACVCIGLIILLALFAAYVRGVWPHLAAWAAKRFSRRLPPLPVRRRPVETPGMFLAVLQPSALDKIDDLPPFYQPNLRNLGRAVNFWCSGATEARRFALAYWRNLGRLDLDDADIVIQAT